MRSSLPVAALIAVALAAGSAIAPALGQEQAPLPVAPEPPGTEAEAPDETPPIDRLFGELKRERNERAAERIASRIQEQWSRSGSASVDLLMLWSQEAMQAKKFAVALDFLDRVTVLQPKFAEGWNRRATVHFMMQSFGKSMADIERTLRLEPRHFGALSGMGMILKETGRKEAALHAYERVLAVYPMMRSAQGEVATLSEDLAGEAL